VTYEQFIAHVASHEAPPAEWSAGLAALWHAQKGNWAEAHTVAQHLHDTCGSWIHAHLHRVEGDEDNAGYWYARALKPLCADSLDAEREFLIREMLTMRAGSGA